MGVKSKISYQQILSLIHQLSREEISRLILALQSEKLPEKDLQSSSLQDIILEAPTWSNTEIENYQKAREHINNSRIA